MVGCEGDREVGAAGEKGQHPSSTITSPPPEAMQRVDRQVDHGKLEGAVSIFVGAGVVAGEGMSPGEVPLAGREEVVDRLKAALLTAGGAMWQTVVRRWQWSIRTQDPLHEGAALECSKGKQAFVLVCFQKSYTAS